MTKRHAFTMKEIAYLRSLPAVESVGRDRIRYAQWFKNDCIVRYRGGDSPARIFRDAGLDSSMIGYKRIERCVARWRSEIPEGSQLSGHALRAESPESTDVAGLLQHFAAKWSEERSHGNGAELRAHDGHGTPVMHVAEQEAVRSAGIDLRDELIAQQIHRIRELEHEIDMLLHRQAEHAGHAESTESGTTSGTSSDTTSGTTTDTPADAGEESSGEHS